MSAVELIHSAEVLTRIFGRWPSFHDAEVVRLGLDRTGVEGPTLEADIHVFEITPEVDAAGYFVLRNHTVVTLRFHDIAELELSGFNHQNVLSDLVIQPADPALHEGRSIAAAMENCFGVGASLVCKRCEVVGAVPWHAAS